MSGLKDIKSSLTSKEQNNKEENIPILLLSKDLINHINSINENDIEIKNNCNNNKDMNINYFHSSTSSNDVGLSLKSPQVRNLNSDINQKDAKNNNIFSSKLFHPSTINSFNGNIPQFINFSRENKNQNEIPKDKNEINPLINNLDNNYFDNNNAQNNMNIMNSCFTMNGKTGWICSNCRNFNYESK
jgi:hypothetical protein